MEDGRLDLREIQVFRPPKGIGASVMEEGAPAIALLGHHVRIGSVRLRRGLEEPGVDAVLAAVGQNHLAQGVLADPPGRIEREISPQAGQVDQHVVGRAPGALGLAANIRQRFARGEDIDYFNLVNDPIAAGQEALAGR
jgi:hypothetical protein